MYVCAPIIIADMSKYMAKQQISQRALARRIQSSYISLKSFLSHMHFAPHMNDVWKMGEYLVHSTLMYSN